MEGGGAQYSSLIGLQLDTYIDMTTSEKTITFQFYTTEAVPMNGMLQLNGEQDGGNPIEMRFTTDGNIGWETITLDFNDAKNGHPYGDALLFMDSMLQLMFSQTLETPVHLRIT